jgi:hypothetical protein
MTLNYARPLGEHCESELNLLTKDSNWLSGTTYVIQCKYLMAD